MSTKFFTNKDEQTLENKFKGIFQNRDVFYFDALIGFFRASGYFRVRRFITNVSQVRILVGINVDDLIKKANAKGLLFKAQSEDVKEDFKKQLIRDVQESKYDQETEEGILTFIEDINTGKLQIKAHPDQNLHAKIYIFRPKNFNEHNSGSVITGSSNLTESGLVRNFEFNVELHYYDDVKFATDTFEELWAQSEHILPLDVQQAIKERTYLNDTFTPFELYIKLLIEYFGNRVDYDPTAADLLLPDKYTKLKYQGDAAAEGYDKLMKYNGFILADVVGLGKTIIASIIAKKFVFENGFHTKILIVYPPALEANWKKTITDFGIKGNVEFISNGSLDKVIDPENQDYSQPDEFDMVIVDEAHKFRNDTTRMYTNLQIICQAERKHIGENGDRKKKVMLLSATPLNNHPADIENQIYLFQNKRNSNLPNVRNLEAFFKPLKEEYDDLKKEAKQKGKTLDLKKVKVIFDKIRDKVIEPLVIRRTRTDIEQNKDYLADITKQGIAFPGINAPVEVRYEFDYELSVLFDKTITQLTRLDEFGNEAQGINYYRYRAIEYLKFEEDRKLYGDVSSISDRLAAIMKTMMVKRLESSFYAFKQSLKRFQQNTQNMIDMFENDHIFIAPDLDVNKYIEEGREDELEIKMNEKGGNNRVFSSDKFKPEFVELLKQDKKIIDELVIGWKKITYDPKWEKFKQNLNRDFLNKKNVTGKLVIFSESKETTQYLTNKLREDGFPRVIGISSDNRKELFPTVQANFDANQDSEKQKDDYDFIITTEVLAEGVNMHRSNVIINYDVPWNATRLMQRIGRVNRIGTKAKEICIFNFYPTDNANNHIKLTETALRKLQAFHTTFGEDSQIYSNLEEMGKAGLYGSKLKEEINETLQFLQELRDFKKDNNEWFNKIKAYSSESKAGKGPYIR